MAANMGDANGGRRGDSARAPEEEFPAGTRWADLPADTRAEYINRKVEKVIADSKVETRKIVAEAVEEFKEDYAAIKSKSIRASVLRNIAEDPLPVDPKDPRDPGEPDNPNGGQPSAPPANKPSSPMPRSSVVALLLRLIGG